MFYILKKRKGAMVLNISDKQIIDTYESINLPEYYRLKYFNYSNSIAKKDNPKEYNDLLNLFDEVNLFKERTEVPNKTFIADKKGKSCLRRSPGTGVITLCYRGASGNKARTPNTCFLTDSPESPRSSWVCMKTFVKSKNPYTNSPVYSISPGNPIYQDWYNYMDSEYTRLTGVKINRFREIVNSKTVSNNVEVKLNSLTSSLVGKGLKVFLNFIDNLEKIGLCKINNNKTSVYDNRGNWISRFEEYTDNYSFIRNTLLKILTTLEESQLELIKGLVDNIDNKETQTSICLFDL